MTKLPRFEMHEKVTGEQREKLRPELKELYENGATIYDLAVEMNRSFGFTRGVLIEAGVNLRPVGENSKKPQANRASHATRMEQAAQEKAKRAELADNLWRRRQEGVSLSTLVRQTGKPRSTVRSLIADAEDRHASRQGDTAT